ncbi:MAG: PAS domain-containing protein [Microthrixaceae bacterium]
MEPDRAPAESSPRPGTDAALAALRGTELLIESLPGAIVAWDVDGTVLAWNANAERLYGWTSGNVLGHHIGELLILPAELDAAYEIALGVEAGEIWTGDLTIVRADATPVRIHTALRPLRNERGEIVGSIGVADDVTDQRAIEDRAAELTNHLLMALAGGELGTWRRDLDTDEIVWDENMERLYGLEPGTYDGTVDGWYAMIHPDDRDATRSTIAAAVAAGSSYQLEYRVLHPDGSIRWLQGRAMVTQHSDGSVAGTIGCSGDVTDRKLVELENERRALEAERLLEAGRLQRRRLEFLSGLNDAAMAADDHQALMQAVTEAAVPTLGDWCSLHFFEGSTVAANPDIIFAHHDPERVEWLRDLLAHHPYDPDAPLGAAAAVREGVTQFIPLFSGEFRERVIDNAVRATPDQARAILDELMPTSLIAVPLVTKRGVIGAMQFVSAESGRVYDADDVALAETAAGRVAEALDARVAARPTAQRRQRPPVGAAAGPPARDRRSRHRRSVLGGRRGERGRRRLLRRVRDRTRSLGRCHRRCVRHRPRGSRGHRARSSHDPRRRHSRGKSRRGARVAQRRHPGQRLRPFLHGALLDPRTDRRRVRTLEVHVGRRRAPAPVSGSRRRSGVTARHRRDAVGCHADRPPHAQRGRTRTGRHRGAEHRRHHRCACPARDRRGDDGRHRHRGHGGGRLCRDRCRAPRVGRPASAADPRPRRRHRARRRAHLRW